MTDGRANALNDPSIKERWTHKKALIVTFLLPLLIGLFGPSLTRIFDYTLWAAAVFLPGVILARVIYDWLGNSQSILRAFLKHIQPLPAGIITGTDLKINSMPWGTLLLIASNLYCYNAEKRAPYLRRLFRVFEKKDFFEALSLFESKYPACLQSISGDVLLKFGLHFLRTGEFVKASSCLKTASEKQGAWQAKALYSLAGAYEERDWLDLAADTLEKVITLFPDSPFGRVAQDDLRRLERSANHADPLGRKNARLLTT